MATFHALAEVIVTLSDIVNIYDFAKIQVNLVCCRRSTCSMVTATVLASRAAIQTVQDTCMLTTDMPVVTDPLRRVHNRKNIRALDRKAHI